VASVVPQLVVLLLALPVSSLADLAVLPSEAPSVHQNNIVVAAVVDALRKCKCL
jgi:hypothetical protein